MQKIETFATFSELWIGVVMGATIVHEVIGSLVSEWALGKTGKLKPSGSNVATEKQALN